MLGLAHLETWADTHVSQATGRLAKWAELDPRRHEPGFLGSVPYVLILRYLNCGSNRAALLPTQVSNMLLPLRFGAACRSLR